MYELNQDPTDKKPSDTYAEIYFFPFALKGQANPAMIDIKSVMRLMKKVKADSSIKI